ncbi:MAG: phosphodiesterase [Lentisphaeria bacterium]|nr:phosphodiesterase [Lentisphaeria bacterium]
MKILFLSDIHGVPGTLGKVLEQADRLGAEQIVLLGDALYHGPRNGVPGFYDPPQVVEMLNARKEMIVAVRGNCDAEVDQMLLAFPVMADFSELVTDNCRFFLTHGHLWNANHLPPVPAGTILCHGHTHLPVLERLPGDITLFNPGSISLPKGGNPQTFGFFDGENLSIRLVEDGSIFKSEPLCSR